MFSRKTIHDEYVKVIKEIDGGERREPQHDRPATVGGRYGADRGDPVDQAAFDELALFGATLDWSTSDAWCIEETSDTMRMAWYLDSPDYGRRFLIYYNSLKLGWVEVSANPEKLFGTVEEFHTAPRARLDMELSMMRFIPQEDAFGLLYQAAFQMQDVADSYDAARERARTLTEFGNDRIHVGGHARRRPVRPRPTVQRGRPLCRLPRHGGPLEGNRVRPVLRKRRQE